MWITRKNGKTVRELSSDERDLLVQFADGTCHGYTFDRASRLLREIRHDGHWLACDCVKPTPTLNVAMRETGLLVLRNNPTGATHLPSCSFAKVDSGSGSSKRPAPITRFLPDSAISLHDEFPASAGGAPRLPEAKTKRQLSLLFTLVEAAGLHEYDPGAPKSISEQYERLREVAGRFHLSGRVPLHLDTHLDKRGLVQMSQRLRDSTHFGRQRRVGILLDVVDSVSGREIILRDGKTLSFYGHVERAGNGKSPLLALSTVTTQAHSSRFFEIGHLGVVPVVSRSNLMPVLDEAERTPILELAALLDWLYKKHHRRVVMRRDLFSGGIEIQLVGRNRSVAVQLVGRPLVDDEGILFLDEPSHLDSFKKRVAKVFLSDGTVSPA